MGLFPKLPKVIQGHRLWYQLKARMNFLFVNNSHLPHLLQLFWDMADYW